MSAPEIDDRTAALELFPLPRETAERFDIYAELLRKWQKAINLVAVSTLPHIWMRHFADSLQVQAAVPDARIWVDLGSGAGFPGLVTAIRLAGEPGTRVHLIESDQRKCAFLRTVSRETGAPAIVHAGRIEHVVEAIGEPVEAVSARALAPLPQLVNYAAKFLDSGAIGVFLKGQDLADELTDSAATRKYQIEMRNSLTSPAGRIVIIARLLRRNNAKA
ncbi:MAG TPA: 16S rRNA (guanine(527)-N(7))-methyltransferase RsmG [Methylovirgula sp.]|nr:16S rRNA (guanine(527)-N(7))-methyltransferase RsmG [Methylovirgula sp.]